MVSEALKAAEIMSKEGISARVVNMSTIKPIDADLIIDCARTTGALVTAEEHSVIGGLGGAVCEVIAENYPVPVRMLGVQDRFGTSGTAPELLEHYGLTAAKIVEFAKDVLSKKC
jgi:transketolase